MPDATPCPFCHPDPQRLRREHPLALALRDAFPASPGHTLFVPRRHVVRLSDTTPEERVALFALLDEVRAELLASANPPDGFNIGVNEGEAAGQTVPHLHVHLIPRYGGDVPDPTGGVRALIPHRQNYRRARDEV